MKIIRLHNNKKNFMVFEKDIFEAIGFTKGFCPEADLKGDGGLLTLLSTISFI